MTSKTALHATLVFEREVPAPVEDVFAAVADPIARTEWGAPSDTPSVPNLGDGRTASRAVVRRCRIPPEPGSTSMEPRRTNLPRCHDGRSAASQTLLRQLSRTISRRGVSDSIH